MPDKTAIEDDAGPASGSDPALPEQAAEGAVGGRQMRGLWPLLLVPLLLAATFVGVTALFSWIGLAPQRPEDLIRELQRGDRDSWRQAVALVQLLRDPAHAELREDRQLAAQLADLLQAELDAGVMSEDRLRLRSFLCRAAGQSRCPEVLPALLRAAETERDPAEIDVRRSALEALADVSAAAGDSTPDPRLVSVVLEATRAPAPAAGSPASHDALRATAAFVLGVLGGEAALARLSELLDERCADIRYNAATGLARHGRVEAEGVLLEMLERADAHVADSERSAHGRAWKRQIVLRNALRSVAALAPQAGLDRTRLIPTLRRLAEDGDDLSIQLLAGQTLQALQAPPAPLSSGYDG